MKNNDPKNEDLSKNELFFLLKKIYQSEEGRKGKRFDKYIKNDLNPMGIKPKSKRLIELIKKNIFNLSSKALTKKRLQARLDANNDNTFRGILSVATNYVKEFLVYDKKEFDLKNISNRLILLESLIELNAPDIFVKEYKQTKKLIELQKKYESDLFLALKKFQQLTIKFNDLYPLHKLSPKGEKEPTFKDFDKEMEYLDNYYIWEKLKLAGLIKAKEKQRGKNEKSIKLLDAIKENLKKNHDWKGIKAIQLYYEILQSYDNNYPPLESSIIQEAIEGVWDEFSNEEYHILWGLSLRGLSFDKVIALYKHRIKQTEQQNSLIPHLIFKNYIVLYFKKENPKTGKKEDLETGKKELDRLIHRVSPLFKKRLFKLLLAAYYFYKGDFPKAIFELEEKKITTESPFMEIKKEGDIKKYTPRVELYYDINYQVLRVKIYYLMLCGWEKEKIQFDKIIANFQYYLGKVDNLDEDKKKAILNFVVILKELAKVKDNISQGLSKRNFSVEISDISRKIGNLNELLFERDWLKSELKKF